MRLILPGQTAFSQPELTNFRPTHVLPDKAKHVNNSVAADNYVKMIYSSASRIELLMVLSLSNRYLMSTNKRRDHAGNYQTYPCYTL